MIGSGKPVLEPEPAGTGDLMILVQQGDMGAYQELVRRYQKKVFRVVSTYHRNPEDAMEVLQDTFMKVYSSRHTWEPDRSFPAWLYRIAINASIDRYRRESSNRAESIEEVSESRLLKNVSPGRNPLQALTDQERKATLEAAIRKLPLRQREVLSMRYLAEMRLEAIAEALGCPLGTVKSNLHKAVMGLKDLLTRRKEVLEYE
jgi:RNA polymerase sigma-70 factor (ECF subfamily)